jgi:cell wall-associated NlpC family hydrolase
LYNEIVTKKIKLIKQATRWFIAFSILTMPGCSTHTPDTTSNLSVQPGIKILDPTTKKKLPGIGYCVQVGAFAKIKNAACLTARLTGNGLKAYYFRHESGLYKVRFGNFSSLLAARKEAEHFVKSAVITDYYLVRPQSYATTRGDNFLRQQLVSTASGFLGIPYTWGGESASAGFDCSGLVMVVYKHNGLKLPRNSRSQFAAGKPVKKEELQKGDLVFFATEGGSRVTHVGIYTGNNGFIHAPKTGKHIKNASLNNSYFKQRFRGGRTYL